MEHAKKKDNSMWKQLISLWKSENLLEEAWEQSYEMLEIDQEMFLEGIRVLRETENQEVNLEIRKKDKIVNKYEREVRQKALTHLAVQGVGDLAAGLVLITIIIDVERIGDYTKNIIDLAKHHHELLKGGKFEQSIKEVENAIKDMFDRVQSCILNSDEGEAYALLDQYKSINKICDDVLTELITNPDESLSMRCSNTLTLYVRYLKRINSHFHNITSSVINPFDRIGYKPKKEK